MSDNFNIALEKFKDIVGNEYVAADEVSCKNYATTTYKTDNTVLAIVKPKTTEEVKKCMQVAYEHNVSVYPISTGMNVGYGSKVPTADNCIILELIRMNEIVDFNEDLAHITVQPGVTQQQLYDYLQEKKAKMWMDATGSFAGHSLIGNLAERGFGHTPYGDHFANVGGLEVVLASGECIHPGFGRFPDAKASGVYRWGVGAYIDGLFTQSNFGIITEATIWLMPEPEYFQSFYFSVETEDELEKVVDLLRPLRLDGTINSAMHIGNDYKVLQSVRLYPWEETKGKTPLSKEMLAKFAKDWDFGAWNASGALYGTKGQVASARKRIKKHLRGKVRKLKFLDDRLLKVAEIFQKPYMWLTGLNLPELLKILKPVFGMTKGIPTDAMIPSTYWRKKNAKVENNDPDHDNCGLMWLAPIAPTSGKNAMEIWKMIDTSFAKYGFDPAVSITLITERTLDCVIAISYDRDVEGEDERAQQCHDELLNKLVEGGFYPYRLGVHSMNGLPKAEEAHTEIMKGIKKVFDPKGILSPGRYEI